MRPAAATGPASAAGSATAAAFIWACALDVSVLKPGNVSLAAPGHGMTAAQFLASARAAAPAVCAPGAAIGARILAAVEATQAVANCNTNLGILLLCAPIAAALEATGPAPPAAGLQRALHGVLATLTVADARAAFRAIALANPGGLGAAADQDVHGEPTVGLNAAMALAGERDLIARQYAIGYGDLFETGLATWQAALEREANAPEAAAVGCRVLHHAMQGVFLAFLSRFPDSHIVRKQGLPAAQSVTQQAQYWSTRQRSDPAAAQAGLARWDEELKVAGLNPGTSADLAVATGFIAASIRPSLTRIRMPRA